MLIFIYKEWEEEEEEEGEEKVFTSILALVQRGISTTMFSTDPESSANRGISCIGEMY